MTAEQSLAEYMEQNCIGKIRARRRVDILADLKQLNPEAFEKISPSDLNEVRDRTVAPFEIPIVNCNSGWFILETRQEYIDWKAREESRAKAVHVNIDNVSKSREPWVRKQARKLPPVQIGLPLMPKLRSHGEGSCDSAGSV